jgi:hypothetical protein
MYDWMTPPKGVFDPAKLKVMTYENFCDLTKEQLAGKIVYHDIKIKGVDFLVWSKYDEHGDLLQRLMVRKSETEVDEHGFMRCEQ